MVDSGDLWWGFFGYKFQTDLPIFKKVSWKTLNSVILLSLWWWFYCLFAFVFLTGKGEFGRLHNYYWNNHQIKSLRLVEYSMSCVNLELRQQWHRTSMGSRGQRRELDNCPTDSAHSFVLPGSGHSLVYCTYSETWCKGRNEESKRKYD